MPLIRPDDATALLCRLLRVDGADASVPPRLDAESWQAVVGHANRHLLAPALHAALEPARVPPDVLAYLAFVRDRNRDRNAAIRRQVADLAQTLTAADAQPVFLKGAACLFDGPYADPSVRMVGDIDVLIDAGRLERALEALRDAGYRIARRYEDGHSAFGDLVSPGLPSAIDLHLEPVDCRHLLSAAEVMASSTELPCGNATCRVPSTTHRVLHNILHAEVHYLGGYFLGRLPLRDLYEFASFARSHAACTDWDFIRRRMTDRPLTTVLYSYVLTQHRLFGGPWPFDAPPGVRAGLHYARRLVQDRHPWLETIARPWANLRSAFSHHRMKARYAATWPPLRPLIHASRYLSSHAPAVALSRLLRG